MRIRQGHLFKRGGIYSVSWRVNGKLFMRSTGKTNRKEAEEERTKIMLPFATGDDVSVLQNIATRIEGRKAEIAKDAEEKNPALTFELAWSSYLQSQARPDSGDRTLKDYSGYFTAFYDWMQKHHADKTALRDVSESIASAYASHLMSAKFSANSFNKHIRFLELLFRVLRDKARVDRNPWENIKRKRVLTASRRELTIEELRKVCLAATGEMRILFALGIYTGLRLGDCATLRWSEVDLIRGVIRRIPSKTARRSPKPVHIPIHVILRDMLTEIDRSTKTDHVLPDTAALYIKSSSAVSKQLHNHFEACGITTKRDGTGIDKEIDADGTTRKSKTGKRAVVEVGFHSLRHTFVSLCREANAPLSVVEAIVGHSNPAMTRHYTHVSESAAMTAVAGLPALSFVDGPSITGEASPTKALPSTNREPIPAWVRRRLGEMTNETWEWIRNELVN